MTPKVIKTNADYEAAMARIEEIFDAKPGTPKGDELELLLLLALRLEFSPLLASSTFYSASFCLNACESTL